MAIAKWNDLQLEFDLGLDEVNDDAEVRAISYMEARQINEAARQHFEDVIQNKGDTGWIRDYLSLLEKGWPWRVACYIAWASSAKADRWPATLGELATEILALTGPRTIYKWRRAYPAIDTVVAMMQAAPLWEHRRDVLKALVDSASDPDYKHHQDRKVYLEMIGDYIPKSQLDIGKRAKGDVKDLSDAELELLAGIEAKQDEDADESSAGWEGGEGDA